jgi:hypothetical protein
VIADDAELIAVLNAIEHPPRHNVLFAGVQYLMARDGGGELGRYYPNFSRDHLDGGGVAKPFREFVLTHSDELIEIGRTRYTQTNECRRCVALLPGIWATPAVEFHLIDFGASAGLNLQIDRYRYSWGDVSWGPEGSPVRLGTEMRGDHVFPREVAILSRTGLDLSTIDPADSDARRWLEALVWPEHDDRRRRLRAALDLATQFPSELISGDALQTLGPAIDRLPPGEAVVVLNSFILNQLPPADGERLNELIATRRAERPIFRVSMEWLDRDAEAAWLEVDDGTGLWRIGAAQPHGEWIELYARP